MLSWVSKRPYVYIPPDLTNLERSAHKSYIFAETFLPSVPFPDDLTKPENDTCRLSLRIPAGRGSRLETQVLSGMVDMLIAERGHEEVGVVVILEHFPSAQKTPEGEQKEKVNKGISVRGDIGNSPPGTSSPSPSAQHP